jgi:phosphoribosylformimino-5-aminoimidazole carboxamide ribotide isomerase
VNVIPAIDLRDGQCIRLYQGKFDRQTTYKKDPVALAREYEKIGFEYLHIVDKAAQIESWLNRGIGRVVIGSLAIADMALVRGWLSSYGPEKIVLALDVTIKSDGVPWLATHGWTRLAYMTLWQCIDTYIPAGLRHVLCTDISRDGALTGPNLDLYAQMIERYPGLKLQAAGGVRSIEDLHALKNIGLDAAICGRALLDGKITTGEIQSFLPAA